MPWLTAVAVCSSLPRPANGKLAPPNSAIKRAKVLPPQDKGFGSKRAEDAWVPPPRPEWATSANDWCCRRCENWNLGESSECSRCEIKQARERHGSTLHLPGEGVAAKPPPSPAKALPAADGSAEELAERLLALRSEPLSVEEMARMIEEHQWS